MTSQVSGKTILITGATSGIGETTALQLVREGAQVIIHGRSENSCQAAIQRIRQAAPNAALDHINADLSSLRQVREMVKTFMDRYDHLDVLINNAGAFFLTRRNSEDGIEMTIAVNHLAHFLLTLSLIPSLKNSAAARIINVSSNAHQGWSRIQPGKFQLPGRYYPFVAYGESKLANLLFTYELARRLAGTKITVNALHPGFVLTQIGMNNGWLVKMLLSLPQKTKLLKQKTVEEGSKTSIYLASSPDVEGITGKYFVDCEPVASSTASYDEHLARGLWEWSAQITRIDFPR